MNGGHDAGCITRTRRLNGRPSPSFAWRDVLPIVLRRSLPDRHFPVEDREPIERELLFLWLLPTLTHSYVECALDPLSRPATLESAPHNSRPRPARSLKTSRKRDSTGCSPSRQRSDDGVSRRAPTHRPFPAQLSSLQM